MLVSSRTAALAFLLGTAVAVPALAQQAAPLTTYPTCTGTPSKQDSDAAHGAYTAGKGSFDEADYTTAITYFKDAYRRDCTKHELLNIIARAYELKGDRVEAVHALETYLKRVPPSDAGNDAIQRRIVNLKKEIAAMPSVPTAQPTTAPTETTPAPTSNPPPVAPPPEAPKEREHTAAPWIVAGAGLVAVAVGIPLTLIGSNNATSAEGPLRKAGCDPVSRTCMGMGSMQEAAVATYNSDRNAALGLEYTGIVLIGVGAVAMIGGVTWHFVEPTGPAPRARLQPVVRPGFAGLSLGGAF